MKECIWQYRPGTNNSHWAKAQCDHLIRPLTRLNDSPPYNGVADWYNGIICFRCHKPVKIAYDILYLKD